MRALGGRLPIATGARRCDRAKGAAFCSRVAPWALGGVVCNRAALPTARQPSRDWQKQLVLLRVGLLGQMRNALDTAGNVGSTTRLAPLAMRRGALRQRATAKVAVALAHPALPRALSLCIFSAVQRPQTVITSDD
jgi:hypothetical protein